MSCRCECKESEIDNFEPIELRTQHSLVHRRPAVVVFAAGEDLETFFQSFEPPAVLVEFEMLPRINAATAQIDITEHHAAEVGQVGDAALAGSDRGIDRDTADDTRGVLISWEM